MNNSSVQMNNGNARTIVGVLHRVVGSVHTSVGTTCRNVGIPDTDVSIAHANVGALRTDVGSVSTNVGISPIYWANFPVTNERRITTPISTGIELNIRIKAERHSAITSYIIHLTLYINWLCAERDD